MSTICIFSALFLPNMGGVECFTDCLSSELAADGHSVVVVTNNTHGLSDREVLECGVEVLRLPCKSLLGGRYPVPIRNERFHKLMGHLDEFEFDGVLINTRFYIHSLIGVRFAEKRGLRPVILDHGSAYLTLGQRSLDWIIRCYEDVITSWIKRRDVACYGISEKSVAWLRHFGIEAKGIISNAIDARAYRAHASDRSFRKELGIEGSSLVVAFVGRLVPEKGLRALVEAMEDLREENIQLLVAGEGPLRSMVESSALANVHLLGRLDSNDVAALLLDSDVLCLPTRSEGFSTTLLEASACGTPSIVTDVGGAKELIPNEKYGVILPDYDRGTISFALKNALSSKSALAAMGSACATRLERKYSWHEVSNACLAAFRME